MELPKLEIASLPTLDTLTGMFGSLAASASPGSDDAVIVLMVFIYEVLPPDGLF